MNPRPTLIKGTVTELKTLQGRANFVMTSPAINSCAIKSNAQENTNKSRQLSATSLQVFSEQEEGFYKAQSISQFSFN